jgi:hypothetical protein
MAATAMMLTFYSDALIVATETTRGVFEGLYHEVVVIARAAPALAKRLWFQRFGSDVWF